MEMEQAEVMGIDGREGGRGPLRIATVTVPAGESLFGASGDDKFGNAAERPARVLAVDSFECAVFPVTIGEWRSYLAAVRGRPGEGAAAGVPDPDFNFDPDAEEGWPVAGVTHDEVEGFLSWLNADPEGQRWRLPTELEWEHACRAGSRSVFSCGDEIGPEDANFLFDESLARVGPGHRTPCGAYPPNAFGLCDLHGNVCEWTSSLWRPSHEPSAPATADRYVVKGGAWDYLPRLLRASSRDGVHRHARRDNLGFRVVR
jgi:formylglycine-generating enzyme required for sulfatase activity